MKLGKVTETVIQRSVFKVLEERRAEVLLPVNVSGDFAAIQTENDEVVVISTDPITGSDREIGIYGVHAVINDVAAGGARPVGVMVTVLMPAREREIAIKRIMEQIEAVCKTLNIQVLGGHTEVTDAVNRPIVSLTGVGMCKKNCKSLARQLKPGDELVLTKYIGMEGTAILAAEHMEELTKRYTEEFLLGGQKMIEHLSVVDEAEIAAKENVSYMKALSERGIYGALWAIAKGQDLGFEVDLASIPVRQETIEICEFYDLNPYQLFSGGCLLIGTSNGGELVSKLQEQGIPAAVIGRITDNNDKLIIREGEKFSLEPPKTDELFRKRSVSK